MKVFYIPKEVLTDVENRAGNLDAFDCFTEEAAEGEVYGEFAEFYYGQQSIERRVKGDLREGELLCDVGFGEAVLGERDVANFGLDGEGKWGKAREDFGEDGVAVGDGEDTECPGIAFGKRCGRG